MKRQRNQEAFSERLEVERKIVETRAINILTTEALMVCFLLLGSKMWRVEGEV